MKKFENNLYKTLGIYNPQTCLFFIVVRQKEQTGVFIDFCLQISS